MLDGRAKGLRSLSDFTLCTKILWQFACSQTGLEVESRELLTNSVMKILADALLLASADVEKPFLQPPPLDGGGENIRDRLEKMDLLAGKLTLLRRVPPSTPKVCRERE